MHNDLQKPITPKIKWIKTVTLTIRKYTKEDKTKQSREEEEMKKKKKLSKWRESRRTVKLPALADGWTDAQAVITNYVVDCVFHTFECWIYVSVTGVKAAKVRT